MKNTNTTKQPKWWNEQHTSAWERMKGALHRDWEQTKADFSNKGRELNQNAADTIKQVAGAERVPPDSQANVKVGTMSADWPHVEPDYRFGVGARVQYGKDHPTWDDSLEGQLRSDWGDDDDSSFENAKTNIRIAYTRKS
jgi:hypothetical protein